MEEYRVDDLSPRQLKFGYWFITNRDRFKNILIISLALISLAFWGYVIVGSVIYIVKLPEYQKIVNSIAATSIDYESFFNRHQPEKLEISLAQVIYNGDNKYDFLASAYNPNSDRGVMEISYKFISGSYESPVETLTILPEQTVYLLSLNNESAKRLTGAVLEIENIKWQSITQAMPLDTSQNPIVILEKDFSQGLAGTNRSWVSFTASNQSVKNIWEVDFQAILFSGSKAVGVNQIQLEDFPAGVEKQAEISWFTSLPRITRVEVVPLINIYDQNIFYEVKGEAIDLNEAL